MSDKSSSSRSSTPIRTGMPKPATQPISDCERRRISITRLERQNILIDGYKKFLIAERNNSNSIGIAEDIEMNLQETIQARDKLVSELRTLPPCLDVNCPDHTTLKSKDNDNLNDSDNDIEMISSNVNIKKSSLKRKNSKGSSDGFVFPSKSARPITPTPVLNPIVTSNSFDNLEQDAEIAQAKSPEIPCRMMSDSDSDMDLNSENSGYSSQSSRSGSPNSTISSKECRKLKNVMKRIRTVDKDIKKFESLILKHKTGAHTEGYKSSLKRSRKTRETLPKKGTPVFRNKTMQTHESRNVSEGVSFADALKGKPSKKDFPALNVENKERQSQPQIIRD
ncbi:uncharacterized protein TNIN_429911 [Trichonephila inaurata madagascariensis]|uniref:Uncharacterized protein n=1 Tax=Trichonephila inaurata madagascariensis TaxID=2747483 RepID=A0A8X7CK56_9ARAC|nr:uncharacterized protein TNIN_429911 [Trichonephila inaurata madagascariensis]